MEGIRQPASMGTFLETAAMRAGSRQPSVAAPSTGGIDPKQGAASIFRQAARSGFQDALQAFQSNATTKHPASSKDADAPDDGASPLANVDDASAAVNLVSAFESGPVAPTIGDLRLSTVVSVKQSGLEAVSSHGAHILARSLHQTEQAPASRGNLSGIPIQRLAGFERVDTALSSPVAADLTRDQPKTILHPADPMGGIGKVNAVRLGPESGDFRRELPIRLNSAARIGIVSEPTFNQVNAAPAQMASGAMEVSVDAFRSFAHKAIQEMQASPLGIQSSSLVPGGLPNQGAGQLSAVYRIELLPRNLGALSLEIHRSHSGIQVLVQTAVGETQQILEAELVKVSELLKSAGIWVEGTEIRHNPSLQHEFLNNRGPFEGRHQSLDPEAGGKEERTHGKKGAESALVNGSPVTDPGSQNLSMGRKPGIYL